MNELAQHALQLFNESPSVQRARAAAGRIRGIADRMHEAAPRSPRIGVVIPAYNEEEHIGQSLRSVIESGYGDVRAYVVVNNSTDGTYELAKKAARPQDRVYNIPQGGVSNARNYGTARALEDGCDVVVYLDGDCATERGALEKVAAAVRSGSKWGIGEVTGAGAVRAQYALAGTIAKVARLVQPLRYIGIQGYAPGRGAFTYVTREALAALEARTGMIFDTSKATCEDVDLSSRLSTVAGRWEYIEGAAHSLSDRRGRIDGEIPVSIPVPFTGLQMPLFTVQGGTPVSIYKSLREGIRRFRGQPEIPKDAEQYYRREAAPAGRLLDIYQRSKLRRAA